MAIGGINGIGNGINAVQRIRGTEQSGQALPAEGEFGAMLRSRLNEVVELHDHSEKLQQDFAAGRVDDMTEVVLAMQKADLALQLTLEMRNKVIDAYQEISRMQV